MGFKYLGIHYLCVHLFIGYAGTCRGILEGEGHVLYMLGVALPKL